MVISVLWPANWVFKNYEYSDENKGEGLDLAMTLVKQ
jgi:FLVCR family feline leukemia virus subgroup C receptor-related protein